eukprot:gene6431-7984_t
MTAISLKQIKKLYGTVPVIHGVDIDIEISSGELKIGDTTVNTLPPSDRDIAMVFQDYALYPHMSVEENMAFGLKMRSEPATEIDKRVAGAADILKLQDYLERLFVARFIGSPTMNTFPAQVIESGGNRLVVQLPAVKASVEILNSSYETAKMVTFGVRPEDLAICDAAEAWFSGELVVVERLGSQTFGYLDAGTEKLITVEFPRTADIRVGERITIKGDGSHIHLFDIDRGKRIN